MSEDFADEYKPDGTTQRPIIIERVSFASARERELQSQLEEAKREILKWQRIRTPTHGPCCTCQKCGLSYDECRCELDDLADECQQLTADRDSLAQRLRVAEDCLKSIAAGASMPKQLAAQALTQSKGRGG